MNLKAGEDSRNKGPTRGERNELGSCGTHQPLSTLATTLVKSRPVKSRFGPHRGFRAVPFHTTQYQTFSHTRKVSVKRGKCWLSALLYSGVGTDLFTFWATARASNRILARALTAFLLEHPLHRPYVYYVRKYEYMNTCIPDNSTYIYRSRILLNFVYFRKYQISRNFRLFF
jgi:hypothetical protein